MPKLSARKKEILDQLMKGTIFEAAVAVLSEHGVKGMTMDRVALAANLAKGSLYRYFQSKKALIEFVYSIVVDPIYENLKEVAVMDKTAIEKLSIHVSGVLDHVAQQLHVFKLLFHDDTAQGLLQTSQRRSRETGRLLMTEIFRQGISEGVFRPTDPFLLACMFTSVCTGVFDTEPELENLEQRESVRHLIMDTLLNGIATEQGRVG